MRSNRFTAIYLASVQHQIKKRFQDCGAVFNIHQPNRPSIQFPSFSFLYWTSSPSTRRDNALALDGDNSSRFQTVPAPALFLLASNTWRHLVFSIFIMSPILYTFGRRAPCVALDLLVRRRPRRGGGGRTGVRWHSICRRKKLKKVSLKNNNFRFHSSSSSFPCFLCVQVGNSKNF